MEAKCPLYREFTRTGSQGVSIRAFCMHDKAPPLLRWPPFSGPGALICGGDLSKCQILTDEDESPDEPK